MRNIFDSKLKIIERPSNIPEGKQYKSGEIYINILNTLDILGETKCIQMTPDEIPTKNLHYFKAYLKNKAKKFNKNYRPIVTEQHGTVYIWKR